MWQEIKQWEVLPGWQVWITISGTALREALTRTLWERPGWRTELLKEKKYDWVVLHIKGTDLAGHDNRPDKKKEIVEQTDQMLGYLLNELDLEQCYISFTADHSTPCKVGDHSGDGVPTFIARAAMSGGIRWIWPGNATSWREPWRG